jgi:NodT family efflux transporter outer membrane factor (OMF) lipoprotein
MLHPIRRRDMLRRRLLMFTVMLPCCRAVSPPSRLEESGVAVPGGWITTREGARGVDLEWVKRFGDRRLEELVKEALAHNPDLKVASARRDQAASLIRSAAAQGLPQLEGRLGTDRSQRNFIGFPFGRGAADAGGAAAEPQVTPFEVTTYTSAVNLQWELDLWGRIRAGTAAAVAGAEAAEADLRAARASLVGQVVRAWFAVAEAEEQEAVAGLALKAAQDTQEALEERFRTGQAGNEGSLGAQLRLARSDVSSARAALAQRKEGKVLAVRALELLLGRYPAGWVDGGGRLPGVPAAAPAGLPSELLLRRPDILAAERRFAAQGMRQKEARRAVFPRLALTGSAGTNTDALSNLLASDYGIWNLGAGLTQTIFTGGQVLAEIRRRGAEQDEALALLQKAVLKAFGEVEEALQLEGILREREVALEEALRLAAEADTEARANYRQGIGDILTVLATQNRALQAKSQLTLVRRLRLDNRVALHLALGGDFVI